MNINEAIPVINRAIEKKQTFMLHGPPGVGKSSIIEQLADENNMDVENKKLSQIDPTALAGVPVPNRNTTNDLMEVLSAVEADNETVQALANNAQDYLAERQGEGNQLTWYRPDWIPSKESNPDARKILFMDELNRADDLQQAAALELMLEKRLGDHELPEGCMVAAAGNRSEDDAKINPMDSALKNRMIHIDIEADVETWKEWAAANGVCEEIMGFISWRPELLLEADEDNHAYPSPRTWEIASDLYTPDMGEVNRRKVLESAVGSSAAKEFYEWEKIYSKINPEDILSGREPVKGKDPSFQYAAVFSILQHAKNTRKTQDFVNQLGEFTEDLSREYQVTFTKAVVEDYDLWGKLEDHPTFKQVYNELIEMS